MQLSSRRSVGVLVGAVALATALNPLNTSMIVVALPQLQQVFGVSTGESTWLLSAFAVASGVGHPLAGCLADRFGPRRVLTAGLLVTAASGLAASHADSFSLLVVLRTLQALGTSTAFPAGVALLQRLDAREDVARSLPTAWLGAVAMAGYLSAAVGPALGGALIGSVGWRAIFLVNVPVAIVGTVLVLLHCPADHELNRRSRGVVVTGRCPLAVHGPVLSVCARFAAVCTVFYGVLFVLPLWLEQSRGFSAAVTGSMMLCAASASALATPLVVRTLSRWGVPWALVLGAGALGVGTCLLATIEVQTPVIVLVGTLVAVGTSTSFNNLGLQAELTRQTLPEHLGTAAGLFQTARFVGAAVAAGLIGIICVNGVTTEGLHRLSMTVGVLSLVLLAWAARGAAAACTVNTATMPTRFGGCRS